MITFRPILPKPINDKAMMDALASEMEKYGPFLKRDFDNTVSSWKAEKPTFAVRVDRGIGSISLAIILTGNQKGIEKWWWLNDGTRPHEITPRSGGMLVFPEGKYNAGSAPGSPRVYSSSFTPTGKMIYAKSVHHPGTQAREWATLIRQNHQRALSAWMQAAMAAAARASGHKI